MLADGSRDRSQLLAMVKGASAADLQALLDAGLIQEGAAAARHSTAGSAPQAEPVPGEAAASGLSYQDLYDSLNALCREQLGLVKGFRYALDIEKANGLDGLREVARRFIADVQKTKGDSAAQMIRRALGTTS